MSTPRYRPVLSPEEIAFLVKHLKIAYIDSFTAAQLGDGTFATETAAEAMLLKLMNKFAALDAKIKHTMVQPAYTALPPVPSLMEQLGESAIPPDGIKLLTPETKRRRAYEKYRIDPVTCTAIEIDDAMEYRFQAGLMTVEEANAYNAKMWQDADDAQDVKIGDL